MEGNFGALQKFIRANPLDRKGWSKSFLGHKARDFEAGRTKQAADLDAVIADARRAGSGGNIFKTALTTGLGSYFTSMAGEGIKPGQGGGFKQFWNPNLKGAITADAGKQAAADAMAKNLLGATGATDYNIGTIVKGLTPEKVGMFGGMTFTEMLTKAMEKDKKAMAWMEKILGATEEIKDW